MRLINADALEKKLNERYDYLLNENGPYDHFTDGYEEATSTVEDFPAVDAEVVVRCKDCKHLFGTLCTVCGLLPRKPEDFCSYGERKEKTDNG